ncbi:CaiB/BaiF CoA transferase family protein [Lacisediminimonas profundi]|uniref:CaiB/BaiF CoA transferase family protein n=1 Tax=Lacisediminimonas profundi TaxID=2603856 RepID=UPI00124AEC0C|nr:CoA transferase [Lacisediminimonas profundi]
MTTLPLAGIRVVDLSSVLMGPYASQWLADFGAEVIKVESPEGDSTRTTGPARETGMSAVFFGLNRSKKSVVIDLKSPDGQQALQQLIGTADVFMHNMRPQKLGKVGLGPATLRARFPRLVYAGLHGFSEDGPYGGKPAYDDIIQGLSGCADLMARQSGTMRYFPMTIADKTSGLVAAMAILAALMKRHASGQGCQVEIPMFETMAAFNLVEHFYGGHFDPPLSEPGYPRVLAEWRRPYRTADGHVCIMPYTDAHWRRFFEAAGQPGHAADPRFSSMSARTVNIGELYRITGEIVAQQDSAYWLELCERIEVPASRVNLLQDLPNDPHLKATGFFERLEDQSMGTLVFPGVPVRFDGERPPVGPAPRHGADTVSVLREAGLDEAQIASLLARGIVVSPNAKKGSTQ